MILGKVGTDLTLEQGRDAARLTALSLLATMRADLGSLDRVEQIVKVFGMVNVGGPFDQTPAVIDGCSDLLVEVFGDRGRHTRSAVGMAALPVRHRRGDRADRAAAVRLTVHLSLVAIVVNEYDPAIDFFVGTPGLELAEDSPSLTNDGQPQALGGRPAARAPATGLLLTPGRTRTTRPAWSDNQAAGRVGFFLRVDDFKAYLADVVGGSRVHNPAAGGALWPCGRVPRHRLGTKWTCSVPDRRDIAAHSILALSRRFAGVANCWAAALLQ